MLPFLSFSPCGEHTESILHRITFLLSSQTLLSLSIRLALRVFRSINERSVVFHEMNALFIDINCSVQFTKVDLTMKILVLGAGVLGCNLTRNLFRAGKDITLLTRGKWAEEIQKNGLRIKDKFSPRMPVTRISVVTELNSKRAIGCGSLSSCAICKSTRFRMHCVRTRPKTSFLSAITCVQEQLPLHSRKKRAVCLLSFRRASGS